MPPNDMNKRRIPRKSKANNERLNVVETRVNEERLAEFRKAYLENGMNAYRAGLAIGMKPNDAKGHAHRYAKLIRIEVREALIARGYGPEKLASLLITCLASKSLGIRLQALDKAFKVRDDYPVPIAVPAAGPVTVIFNTDLEEYKHASGKVIDQASVSHESTGDVGGRASQKAITGRSIRDSAESGA